MGCLRNKYFFVTFKVWLHGGGDGGGWEGAALYEKQLGSLGGYIPLNEMCCVCVKSLLFSFCVYVIKGDDALTEISSFEAKWDEQKSV